MLEAKQMAQKLISRFQSNDPFRIADSLDYIVIFVPLRGIRGFHQYVQRNHIIYIDNSLDEVQQRWVCAHELGHALMHPNLSTPFLRDSTLFSVNKLEVEANRFAICLCYPSDYLHEEFEGFSSAQIAESLCLPLSLVEYAMK